jgi:hypothetical protein
LSCSVVLCCVLAVLRCGFGARLGGWMWIEVVI